MSTDQWVAQLRALLEQHASPEKATHMRSYMRDQFDFFGINAPDLRRLVRGLVQAHGKPELAVLEKVVRRLWREPERELQHAALDLLHGRVRELDLAHLPLLEFTVTNKSWWDTVDFISYKLVGKLLSRHPQQERAIIRRYSQSDNLWLIRVSIIFQLLRKEATDTRLLEEVIRQHAAHEDFFVRKAIGWALRDYARTDPDWVRRLADELPLSNLSRREALKHL